jgi:hypothetical protein
MTKGKLYDDDRGGGQVSEAVLLVSAPLARLSASSHRAL